MRGPDWSEDDELFLRELRTGHEYAVLVADRLRAAGLHVDVTPMEVRADIDDRVRFVDEHDLTVGTRQPCRIDVKSRTLRFTGPADYPYQTAFVDTVAGWEAKQHKPMAIVLVSQPTEELAVISVRGAPAHWTRERRYDNTRRIHDWFYMVSRERLRTLDELVAWLLARDQDGRAEPRRSVDADG
jgi:hypothetical protein